MSKPAPIIRTRVPADLQQVFIKANRGEVVDVPPQAIRRHWGEERAARIKKSASFPDLMDLDIAPPRSPRSNAIVPSGLSLSFECEDHYSDVSSQFSSDNSTTYEHLEVLQGKQRVFSRWDAEYTNRKSDTKLPPFRRQGSSRWELKTVEEGAELPRCL